MADEVLTTSLTELQGKGGVLSAVLLEASAQVDHISQHLSFESVAGRSDQAEFARKPAVTAAALTEGAAASNTAFATTSVTVSVGETGNLFDISDLAAETQGLGAAGLMDIIEEAGAMAIARLRASDIYALFNSLSTSVNAAGSALGLTEFLEAYFTLKATNHGMGTIVAHLSDAQGIDLMEDLQSTNASVYTAQQMGQGGEGGSDGRLATVLGIPVYTDVQAESDGGANKYGCVMVDGSRNRRMAPFGWASAWMPRAKTQFDASSGSTLLRTSEARGVGEIADEFAVNILSLGS